MKLSPRTLLCSLALAIGFAAAPARAVSVPVWKVTIPAFITSSTSSTLSSITSDSAGNAFIVIGAKNGATVVSSRLILLSPKGKVIFNVESPGPVVPSPVLVSAKRVVVSYGGPEFILLLPDGNGGASGDVFATTEDQSEVPVPPTLANLLFKYVHTTVSPAAFVTEVKRYLITKLK